MPLTTCSCLNNSGVLATSKKTVMKQTTFLALLCCLMNTAQAQTENLSTLRKLSLSELMEVTITGSTMTDESLNTVPAAVTVFSHEQIKRLGVNYLHELVNLVPSYQSQRNTDRPASYAYYSVRGRRSISESTEVLLLIDGKSFNEPLTSSANDIVPLSQVERVEIIRGPGSALYGASAHSGIINIITRKGVNEVGASVGAFSHRKAHALGSFQQGDLQLDAYAYLEQDHGDSYQVQDTFTLDSVKMIETHDPRTAREIQLNTQYRDTTLHISHRQRTNEQFYALGNVSNEINYNESRQTQISLEHDLKWSEAFNSHLLLNWIDSKNGGTIAVSDLDLSPEAIAFTGAWTGESLQAKWHNHLQLQDYNSVQFGVEWSEVKFNYAQFSASELGLYDIPVAYLVAHRNVGLYAQYLHEFTPDTHLTLGARYDNAQAFDSRLSPRIGLVHQLNETQSIKVLYGEAFRTPSLFESRLFNNFYLLGNSELKSEVVKTWDLIWLLHNAGWNVSLGWFFNQYETPISMQPVTKTASTYVNGEDSEAQGFELEASYQLNDSWLLRGTLSYFSQLPDTAFREADILASVLLNYESGAWNWNLSGFYHGERDTLGETGYVGLADYWVFDTKLQYHLDSHWLGYLQVQNLWDKEYQTTMQIDHTGQGVPNRGRAWFLGMEYTF